MPPDKNNKESETKEQDKTNRTIIIQDACCGYHLLD